MAIVFQNGWESGDDTAWDVVQFVSSRNVVKAAGFDPGGGGTPPDPATTNVVYNGTYAKRIRYDLPTTGDAHLDVNRHVRMETLGTLQRSTVAGYVWHNTALAAYPGVNIQRKLYYLKSSASNQFASVLTSFDYQLAWAGQVWIGGVRSSTSVNFNLMLLEENRWYLMEMETFVNTPVSSSNGYVKVWVDGVLKLDRTGLRFTDDAGLTGITQFEVGNQADRTNSVQVEEYRYWDNIWITDGGPEASPFSPLAVAPAVWVA